MGSTGPLSGPTGARKLETPGGWIHSFEQQSNLFETFYLALNCVEIAHAPVINRNQVTLFLSQACKLDVFSANWVFGFAETLSFNHNSQVPKMEYEPFLSVFECTPTMKPLNLRFWPLSC